MNKHEVDKIRCAIDTAQRCEAYALEAVDYDCYQQDVDVANEMWRTAVCLLLRELCSE